MTHLIKFFKLWFKRIWTSDLAIVASILVVTIVFVVLMFWGFSLLPETIQAIFVFTGMGTLVYFVMMEEIVRPFREYIRELWRESGENK